MGRSRGSEGVGRVSSRKSPKGGKNRFSKKNFFFWGGGGAMHLAILMHSNHVICIVGVSRG